MECARLYDTPLSARPGRDHIVAELDGCMIRTGEIMSARRALRTDVPAEQRVRTESWREVRTGLARGLDEVDPTCVCGIGSYEDITEKMFGAACHHGLTERTMVIAPSDGAFGLREALDERFPQLHFVLDDVWNGKVSEVLTRLTSSYHGSGNQRLRRLTEYVERVEDSVSHKHFVELGWPIGSGEVESAHRYIPQARLNIPGACWRVESINPMLALRLRKAVGWWSRYWEADKDRLAAA